MEDKKNVVTVEQLTSVATAQKSYIDSKVKAANDAVAKEAEDRDTAIEAAKEELEEKLPTVASDDEIKSITDLFAIAG